MRSTRFLTIWCCLATASASLFAQALDPKLLTLPAGDSWPTYHGDYTGRHFSSLKEITAANVKGLTLAWTYHTSGSTQGAMMGGTGPEPEPPAAPAAGAFGGGGGGRGGAPAVRGGTVKSIPLMVNGVLYLSTQNNAYAVDARTGQEIWHYYWRSATSAIGNRGMAMYGNWVYFETPDGHLVSLDAATGKERWNKELSNVKQGYFTTMAPTAIGNHIVVGTGGDTTDIPTWLESRDPETGDRQWIWYSTPQTRAEPGVETWPSADASAHGGGGPWQPPTYDRELNLLYITTANPNPVYNGLGRKGDNLYTSSVVALNPDTGKMAWYYQFSPHDTHDWDATQVTPLIDATINGVPRKLLAQANRGGWFFVLDRTNGKSLVVKPYLTNANAYKGADAQGHMMPDVDKEPSVAGSLVSPSSDGASNYPAQSFDPDTGLYYVNAIESYSIYYLTSTDGKAIGTGESSEAHTGLYTSYLRAIDFKTGAFKWEHKYDGIGFPSSTHPGILTTAGGVLFSGDPAGNFLAYDAATGKILWHFPLGIVQTNSPETFRLDGRQYVVVAGGDALYGFYLQ